MTWSEVLDELNAGLAEADEDLWYHLTAMGMTERSLDEAKDATDLLASHVPNLRDVRVADLGCGVGRHLVALAQHTTNLLGVEASPSLARLAAEFVPDARVETASFHDLAELGAFDVVCAFSHILMLADGREGVIGNLQLIRGAMPDYGLLVVEAPKAPGSWKNAKPLRKACSTISESSPPLANGKPNFPQLSWHQQIGQPSRKRVDST